MHTYVYLFYINVYAYRWRPHTRFTHVLSLPAAGLVDCTGATPRVGAENAWGAELPHHFASVCCFHALFS